MKNTNQLYICSNAEECVKSSNPYVNTCEGAKPHRNCFISNKKFRKCGYVVDKVVHCIKYKEAN